MFPPFVNTIIAVLARLLLSAALGYLTVHGYLTADQSTEILVGVTGLLVVLAWSYWQKHADRLKLLTAVSMANTTEAVVEAKVADPAVVNPSVLTPRDTAPTP